MSIRKNYRVRILPFALAALPLLFLSIPAWGADLINWEKIIDNGDPGYTEIGAWNHRSGLSYAYDNDYAYLSWEVPPAGRKGTATWKTVIPYSGIYRVKADTSFQ